MPLPFIVAAIAALGTLSTTTLVVGGAAIALGVIATVAAFRNTVRDWLQEKSRAKCAKVIKGNLKSSNYNECDVGLLAEDRHGNTIAEGRMTVSRDVYDELRDGEIIYR